MKSFKVINRKNILDFSNFTKRPKREKEGISHASGKAHSNFSSHGGGFRGSMSMNLFTNAQNISGTANRGRSANFVDYISRKEECVMVYGDKDLTKKNFNEIDEKLLLKRRTSVLQRRLVIQLPREFLNNAESNMNELCKRLDDKFFNVSKAYFAALHQGGKDFTNPHVHLVFSNCDANYQNIRNYNSREFTEEVKKEIAQILSLQTGLNIQVPSFDKKKDKYKKTKHYQRWVTEAYKRAQIAGLNGDGGAMMEKYTEKYPVFAEFRATYESARLKAREKKIDDGLDSITKKMRNCVAGVLSGLNPQQFKEQKQEVKQEQVKKQEQVQAQVFKKEQTTEQIKKEQATQEVKTEVKQEPAKQEQTKEQELKPEQELKQEPQKQEQTKKQEPQTTEQIKKEQAAGTETKQEQAKPEPVKDAFTLDLERRLNKNKGLEQEPNQLNPDGTKKDAFTLDLERRQKGRTGWQR